jgi:NAD+ kinase
VCLRVDRLLTTLHRECTDKRVLLVCHGEIMWAFRVRLERMSQECYQALDRQRHPHAKIHNGQVVHFTRRDPSTGKVEPFLGWMRSVCPWDLTRSDNAWHPITRQRCSSAELLALVEQTPRLWED